MKYLKLFVLLPILLFLQPSFACGCGEEYPLSLTNQILTWMMMLVLLLIYLLPSLCFVKFYKFLSLKIAHLIVPHIVLFLMIGLLIYSVDLGLMKIYDQIRDVVPSFFVVFIIGIMSLLLWFYPIIYIIKMNEKRTTLKF